MRSHMQAAFIAVMCVSLAVLTTACSRSERADTATTETKQVEVSRIDLGRSVGTDKRVTDQTALFTPNETIYASVITVGSAPNSEIKARWIFEDGQVVDESTRMISATGNDATEFHVYKADGWPAGKYKLEVYLNGTPAGTKEFEVKSS